MSVIEAYITNLGRYNKGHLDGEYLRSSRLVGATYEGPHPLKEV
ncbi:hypothetical protein ABH892_003068 [Paenibacillus sp. RC254]